MLRVRVPAEVVFLLHRAHERLDLLDRISAGRHRADQGSDARADDRVVLDAERAQRAQHAEVRHAAHASAAQDEHGARPVMRALPGMAQAVTRLEEILVHGTVEAWAA
jgi:hypothetical protein